MRLIKSLIYDEQGASLTEYALLLAVLTIGMLGSLTSLGTGILDVLSIPISTLTALTSGS